MTNRDKIVKELINHESGVYLYFLCPYIPGEPGAHCKTGEEVDGQTFCRSCIEEWLDREIEAPKEEANEYYSNKGVDALNGTNGDTRTLMSILYKDYDYEMKLMDEERNQSLDDLHDYASGNDLKRALGHPESQKERKLPKAPTEESQESEDEERGLKNG